MRVLHVISSIDPRHGGVSEGVRQLAAVSVELGCQVEVATLDRPGLGFLNEFPCLVHALGPGRTHFRYSHRLSRWLAHHVQDFDIVVIHALWQYHSVAVRKAARRHNIPYVVYPHGMLDPYFKQAHPLKHMRKWLFWPWADYRVLRDAAAVLFTTEEERRLARQSFWLYSAREKVVNLGTTHPAGDPEEQRQAFYRRFPGLQDKPFILFLGRIHPKKGCDLVLQSFASVLGDDKPWRLVMAGPDQVGWRSTLELLAVKLGIEKRITWTGMLNGDEKWGAIRTAAAFFLPSHQENFGVAVAEALACGTPALLSDKVNIWREIEEAEAGLVGPDTRQGAEALLRNWVALGEQGRDRLRSNALYCFQSKFEIHRATAGLLHTLQAVLNTSVSKASFADLEQNA